MIDDRGFGLKMRISAALACASLLIAGWAVAEEPIRGIPAECLNINTAPYSASQGLDIKTGGQTAHFNVEIAETPAQREQGLMCRSGLHDDYGMLFEFQDVADRTFWMKDTLLGLDIIYIAPDGRGTMVGQPVH